MSQPLTCDTSVLVPALLPAHEHHALCRRDIRPVSTVPAHVLLETYRVLTSLPGAHRVPPAAASEALHALGWSPRQLSASKYLPLIAQLATSKRGGGPIFDAQIAATCTQHGLRLLTLDQRAVPTYDAFGLDYTLLSDAD
ncbi:MAG: PIN domain-containing protein [Microbacterium sp.]